jgi:hypothetical protein
MSFTRGIKANNNTMAGREKAEKMNFLIDGLLVIF